jgi:hypothetical protein
MKVSPKLHLWNYTSETINKLRNWLLGGMHDLGYILIGHKQTWTQ